MIRTGERERVNVKFSHTNNKGPGTNKKTSIPLYVRIESLIRNRILNGQLEPGEKLPTEGDLINQFGVSQITIRKALSNLEQEGLIVRNRAKGTFVSEEIALKKNL